MTESKKGPIVVFRRREVSQQPPAEEYYEEQPPAVVSRGRVGLMPLCQVMGRDPTKVKAEDEARRQGKKIGKARGLLIDPNENIRLAAEAGAKISDGDPDFMQGVVDGEMEARRNLLLKQLGGQLLVRVSSLLRRRS